MEVLLCALGTIDTMDAALTLYTTKAVLVHSLLAFYTS
jgi:hypothetical protein